MQRGEPLIEAGQTPAHAVGAGAEGVAHAHFTAMHVPARSRRPAAGLAGSWASPAVDCHEADSRLDQPARQQEILSERMATITIPRGGRFPVQFEDLPAAGSAGQFEGATMQLAPIPGRPHLLAENRRKIDRVEQAAPPAQAFRLNRGLELVGSLEVRQRGMVVGRADKQRAALGAEMAAVADVRGAEDRITNAADEPNVIRQVALGGPYAREDGTEVRRIGGGSSLAAQQVVHGVEVVADISHVCHRTDQAEMLRQRR